MLDFDDPAALTQAGHADGWLTPERAIATLSKPGEGNMNQVRRAGLDNGDTLILKQAVPFVAKFPDIPAPIERAALENEFYQFVQAYPVLAQRMPGRLSFTSHAQLICLEDLGATEDYTRCYAPGTPGSDELDHIATLLQWLAELHAISLSDESCQAFQNHAMRRLNHEHIFALPFQSPPVVELSPELSRQREQLLSDNLTATAANLGDIYLGQTTATQLHLTHGDFYPGSWVEDKQHRIYVIDPEFAFAGRPEFDVGIMLAHLTFCGLSWDAALHLQETHYHAPNRFDWTLAQRFAAVEILRRIWGVAQLPLTGGAGAQLDWVEHAAQYLQEHPF